MAMGKRRRRARQKTMWVASADLPQSAGHPFYQRLNQVLDDAGFDAFVEPQCARFYADGVGRPSLAPGRYFRLLLLGYFEGLDSERAIAWRADGATALDPTSTLHQPRNRAWAGQSIDAMVHEPALARRAPRRSGPGRRREAEPDPASDNRVARAVESCCGSAGPARRSGAATSESPHLGSRSGEQPRESSGGA